MSTLIAYPNRTDESTLSGGAWTATLPLSNLQSRLIAKVARSTDAANASTKFDLVLAKKRLIRVLSLVNHNLSSTSTYRIRSFADAGFTNLIYDSGVAAVWPVVYPSGILEWEADNFWSGQLLDEDKIGYNLTLVHVLATATFAQYFRFEFFDSSNPAGYVQIGRLFLASEWQPVVNMNYGASLAYETKTAISEAISGAEYFDRRTPYRVARFTLGFMSEDEGMARAFDLQRTAGIDGEVLYMWDTKDTVHRLRRSFLGRLRSLSAIDMPYFNNTQTSFEIKELL